MLIDRYKGWETSTSNAETITTVPIKGHHCWRCTLAVKVILGIAAALRPTIIQRFMLWSSCFESFSHFVWRSWPEIRTESWRQWQTVSYIFSALCCWIRALITFATNIWILLALLPLHYKILRIIIVFFAKKNKQVVWGINCNKDGGVEVERLLELHKAVCALLSSVGTTRDQKANNYSKL